MANLRFTGTCFSIIFVAISTSVNAESGSIVSSHTGSSCTMQQAGGSDISVASTSTALVSSSSGSEANLTYSSAPSLNKKRSKNKRSDPLNNIYKLVNVGNLNSAKVALESLQTPHKQADRYNLMGLIAQRSGEFSSSLLYYKKALAINPRHVKALHNQAELFIKNGELEKARDNLTIIDNICWLGCNEKKSLESAIELASN